MQLDRWNTDGNDTLVKQTVFDVEFQLAQDPASNNHGTTVWDASIVLAKYLEKNARKGDLCRAKVSGRRAVELGAGMGLGGMAFALLGAEVTLTDTTEAVLSLLRRNAEANLSPAALRLQGAAVVKEGVGCVSVAELDWTRPETYAAVGPPFDYVLAADCVYSETMVPHLLAAAVAMAGPRTTVAVCSEFRSQSVHDTFLAEFSREFSMKKVAMARMHPEFQHPLIHLYLMKKVKQREGAKPGRAAEDVTAAAAVPAGEEGEGRERPVRAESTQEVRVGSEESGDISGEAGAAGGGNSAGEEGAAGVEAARFVSRRQGAALAQQLKGVTLGS